MKWSLICAGILSWLAAPVSAQGLLWSLPEDGTAVRYEGTYSQAIKRLDEAEADVVMEWKRVISLKSVGMIDAEFRGKSQPCRWIEMKCETGKEIDGMLETGPGAVRLYKILVPEAAIRGQVEETLADGRTIPVSFIPVVKGFLKIGDQPPESIESGVFDLYPLLSLLRHYQDFKEMDAARPVDVPAGQFDAARFQGVMTMETPTERSSNTCEMERSAKFPFGVVKWSAKSVIEAKGSTDSRSAFKESMTVTETMEATAIAPGAESELTEG